MSQAVEDDGDDDRLGVGFLNRMPTQARLFARKKVCCRRVDTPFTLSALKRNNGDGRSWDDPSEEAAVRELEGYVEMGMRRKACALVRQILAQKRISSAALDQVSTAIGLLSDPKQWIAELESAWQRQPASVRRDANSAMLALYASADR